MRPEVSLVQPVNESGAGYGPQSGIVREQAVEERSVAVARSGVHDESRRLVQHQEVGVFVDDGERSGLCLRALVALDRAADVDSLSSGDPVPGPHRRAVEGRRAGANPALDARAGVLRKDLRDGLVGPQSGERPGDHPVEPDEPGHANLRI